MKVIELFAGVGGFRLACEAAGAEVIWSNQWEPSQKFQTASEVYIRHFGVEGHSNVDIAEVVKELEKDPSLVPAANLLVGGFPCQDYSVAKSKSQSFGIKGKKGVLWWEIFNLLRIKSPRFVLLENVDRLLSSPSKQKGRDFAVMLEGLSSLGYEIEWKAVNAADYGYPQRRKRLFIFASKKGTNSNFSQFEEANSLLFRAFPSEITQPLRSIQLAGDMVETSESFNRVNTPRPFASHGVCIDGEILMATTVSTVQKSSTLRDVLVEPSQVPNEFWIECEALKNWEYLKGAKAVRRVSRTSGFEYEYKEGKMAFPDSLEAPSRTIVTGEGGRSPSRFKHVVMQNGRFRRLVPVELERLNGFPDEWTRETASGSPVSDTKRAFLMGNALVIGAVERIVRQIISRETDSN